MTIRDALSRVRIIRVEVGAGSKEGIPPVFHTAAEALAGATGAVVEVGEGPGAQRRESCGSPRRTQPRPSSPGPPSSSAFGGTAPDSLRLPPASSSPSSPTC